MSLQVAMDCSLYYFGDGTSTVVVFDLLRDTYAVHDSNPLGSVGGVVNWFSGDRKANPPTGVVAATLGATVVLADDKLTVTFASAPPVGFGVFRVYLKFG